MSRQDGKLRPGEITTKDMELLRDAPSTRQQHKSNSAQLRDYGLQHEVIIKWELNPDAIRERIFSLKIDGIEVFLDAEEVMRAVRWV